MSNSHCKNCGASLVGKKSNAEYCSSTCRSAAHRAKKNNGVFTTSALKIPDEIPSVKPSKSFFHTLKGVISDEFESTNGSFDPMPLNPQYTKFESGILTLQQRLDKEWASYNSLLQEKAKIEGNKHAWLPLQSAFASGTLCYAIGNERAMNKPAESRSSTRGWWTFFGLLAGAGGGYLYNIFTEDKREKEKLNQLKALTPKIAQQLSICQDIIWEKNRLENELKNTKKYLPIEPVKTTSNIYFQELLDDEEFEDNNDVSGVIIPASQMKEMVFESLDFKGRWAQFLGKPARGFHAVVHGKPGQGKSTFAIQFANYLAQNFGRAVYISGEEGFSKTMKDKLSSSESFIDELHIADIHSADEILEVIKPKQYHFMFFDSLDDLGIDALRLKQIRDTYRKSALITISQSTKGGQMRGSQQIVHDCDIAIMVENGMAITTKNRYFPSQLEFEIL